MSNGDDRLVILRFSDSDELKEFFNLFKDSGLGSLVKVGDDDDWTNNQEKNVETKFSEIGLSKYDEKKADKPNLI